MSFTHRERQSLNDTLAIVSCESGAERKVGPPVTLPSSCCAKEVADRRFVFWSETLSQLEETVAMLRERLKRLDAVGSLKRGRR